LPPKWGGSWPKLLSRVFGPEWRLMEDILMTEPVRKTLFWTPRVVCILLSIFVSLFALDSFGPGQPLWRQVAAFLIHLIPVYFLVVALVVSWRWEWVGAIIFPALGLWYMYMTRLRFHWTVYLTLTGVPVLLGVLFLLGWLFRAQIRQRS
jgi:hypothetical protein